MSDYLDSYIYFNCKNTEIKHIQAYESKENQFIQLADLFAWAIGYDKNKLGSSITKRELTKHIAKYLEKESLDFKSNRKEEKFNIFEIQLKSQD